MKKLLLIGTAFAALIAPAMADQKPPVRVYKHPAAPVYSWTGFYVGGNVGYSWGNARTDIAGSGTWLTFVGVIPGFPGFPSTVTFADSNTARLSGVIGGGQIGYKIQLNPKWVLGFETDIQASGERGSNTFVDPFLATICQAAAGPFNCNGFDQIKGTATTAYDAKIGWFGTARGSLGFLLADQVLLYGTGGLAYGRVELSGTSNTSGSSVTQGFSITPGATVFDASKTKVGFAVGGGAEGKCSYLLPAGWMWKLEYLYIDLGSIDTVSPFPAAFLLGVITPLTGPLTTHTRFTDNIVRVGLNYKFGNYYAPVVTK